MSELRLSKLYVKILTNTCISTMHEQKTSPYMVTSIIRRCDWLESVQNNKCAEPAIGDWGF